MNVLMASQPLTRARIEEALAALADTLAADGHQAEITIVGGAALALAHDARPTTRDVDVLAGGTVELWAAATAVAQRLALPSDWLNGDVRRVYTNPAVSRAHTVLDRPGLRVFVADVPQLLAMKLCAFRDDLDVADARLLLTKLPPHLDQESVWVSLESFLMRGRQRAARENFEDLWEERNGAQ